MESCKNSTESAHIPLTQLHLMLESVALGGGGSLSGESSL